MDADAKLFLETKDAAFPLSFLSLLKFVLFYKYTEK